MVKQAFNPTFDKNGEPVELEAKITDGAGRRFSVITPNYYPAVMTSMVESVFNGRDGSVKYLKLQPEIALINENRTLINRQDLVVGYWNDATKQLYHNDPSQSVVWGGATGALFLLSAMGLYKKLPNGKFELEYDAKLIQDRPIRVQTGIAGYVKGNNQLTNLVSSAKLFGIEMNTITYEQSEGREKVWTILQLDTLIQAFNRKYGLSGVGDDTLKTKNVIVGYYPVSKKEIADYHWYLDEATNQVFTTKAGYDWYQDALVNGVSASGSDSKKGW